ncbi:hypothetical protein SEA_MARGARET_55 [Gordonia phage Margaret]|nr:hypothetical protein SEA_MARGARET_55 [Gordonia phage Margaret]
MSTDAQEVEEYWVWYQHKHSEVWFHIVAEDLVAANRVADVLTSEGARSVQIKERHA